MKKPWNRRKLQSLISTARKLAAKSEPMPDWLVQAQSFGPTDFQMRKRRYPRDGDWYEVLADKTLILAFRKKGAANDFCENLREFVVLAGYAAEGDDNKKTFEKVALLLQQSRKDRERRTFQVLKTKRARG